MAGGCDRRFGLLPPPALAAVRTRLLAQVARLFHFEPRQLVLAIDELRPQGVKPRIGR